MQAPVRSEGLRCLGLELCGLQRFQQRSRLAASTHPQNTEDVRASWRRRLGPCLPPLAWPQYEQWCTHAWEERLVWLPATKPERRLGDGGVDELPEARMCHENHGVIHVQEARCAQVDGTTPWTRMASLTSLARSAPWHQHRLCSPCRGVRLNSRADLPFPWRRRYLYFREADRAAHEEVGARQPEAQGAEMASSCYAIAVLLSHMETIRAGE